MHWLHSKTKFYLIRSSQTIGRLRGQVSLCAVHICLRRAGPRDQAVHGPNERQNSWAARSDHVRMGSVLSARQFRANLCGDVQRGEEHDFASLQSSGSIQKLSDKSKINLVRWTSFYFYILVFYITIINSWWNYLIQIWAIRGIYTSIFFCWILRDSIRERTFILLFF